MTSTVDRVHVFPPKLERSYAVVGGRVQTRSLEAHVVDHCNLTCAECCSLSPLLPKWTAGVDDLARDLRLARRVLAPRVFKLVGGEPTMHPEIVALLEGARAADIAPVISLTTNGLLLPKMSDAFFAAVDALTISLYPAPALTVDAVAHIEARARAFDVELNWKKQDEFVRMNREALCVDDDENGRVYDSCWLRERCHMLRDGVFYTCTRPPHFHSLHAAAAAASDSGDVDGRRRTDGADGLRLDDDVDAARVLAYLTQPKPLAACALCHGGSATMGPHRQLTRDEVAAAKSALLRIMPS